MSFYANLAKKYIFAQKRHSALTVLSIAAAVALITVLFTIYSTYFNSMLEFKRSTDPWHAYVYNITEEKAEAFVMSGDFVEHKFELNEYEMGYSTVYEKRLWLKFSKDTEDCDEALERAANAAGFSFNSRPIIERYFLNEELLQLENIGVDAKAANAQLFFSFYALVLFVIFCSRLVIDTSFEISSKEREKQFGILQSIGASKKQIASVMTWEGAYLSLVGIPLGLLFGTGISYLLYLGVKSSSAVKKMIEENTLGELTFSLPPLFILVAAVTGLLWVLFSAYGTGMRAAKMSPVEAISSRGAAVERVGRHSIFGLIFGWTGRLASRNIRREKKRFIITIASVTLSILLFVSFAYLIDVIVSEAEYKYAKYRYDFAIQESVISEDSGPMTTDDWGEDYLTGLVDDNYDKATWKLSYREINHLLNDSGYFDNVVCAPRAFDTFADKNELPVSEKVNDMLGNQNEVYLRIYFVDEILYKKIMGESPEIPYSELNEKNGYVLLNSSCPSYYTEQWGWLYDTDNSYRATNVSKGDYIPVKISYTPASSNQEERQIDEFNLKILDISEERNGLLDSWDSIVYIIGTYDQYDKYFMKYDMMAFDFQSENELTRNMEITADLKAGASYENAMKYLDMHGLKTWENAYSIRVAARDQVNLTRMIGYTILALMTLISIINLMNVISTGIINRRPELAAMKSLGMSRWQLVKLILIECAQYAIVSGVSAMALSELMLLVTVQTPELLGMPSRLSELLTDYSKPIYYSLVAMAVAFVCAMTAAILPLRQIERSSITDEIKRID